jgi:hypothetical protein
MDEVRIDSASPFAVPEPTAFAAILLGAARLLGATRRRAR